jgi:hypothetical protein
MSATGSLDELDDDADTDASATACTNGPALMSGMHDGENRHRGAMIGGRCGGQYEVGRQLPPACAELRYYYCMTDSNVVSFPKDQRDPQWWEFTPVLVRWMSAESRTSR